MLSWHHAFRIGSALLVFAGIGWFAANLRAPVAGSSRSSLPRQLPVTSRIQPEKNAAALSAAETAEPQFKLIHELLGQQRQLGPADREREDEIRHALLSLLADVNAEKIIRSLSSEALNSEFGLAALTRWATTDTLAAALWLAQQPAQSAEQTWVIAHTIVKDPVGLEVLSERLSAGPWRETLLANTSLAALPDNPHGAIQLAQRLQPGTVRTRALLTIADDWTLRDPVAAARWIASEQDLPLRDELILASSAAQASTDPLGALSGTSGISSAAIFEQAIGKITAMWTDYEPARARHFAALVESTDNRTIPSDGTSSPEFSRTLFPTP